MPASRPLAPSMPVSSVAVKSASMGPCSTSVEARMAMVAATPMPLSAPRVVPLAFTQSPSTMVSMGSFSKSWALSLFFCGTMSRWPCRITPLRFSIPGVAGFRMMIFPASSRMVSKPRPLPNCSTWSRIISSWLEGRGICVSPWKKFHSGAGSSCCIVLLIDAIFYR